jgi:hypothetical protein
MNDSHDRIITAYNTYLIEIKRFEDNNVKASAARARQALSDIAKMAKERRKEIQDKKNAM